MQPIARPPARPSAPTYYDKPEFVIDDTGIVEATAAICDEFEAYGYRRQGAQHCSIGQIAKNVSAALAPRVLEKE